MEPIDRRKFMQKAGLAGAATGAVWVAPSVLGSSLALAASPSMPCGPAISIPFVAGSTSTTNGDGNGISATPSDNLGWTYVQAGMVAESPSHDKLGVFSNYLTSTDDRFAVVRNPDVPLVVANSYVTYTHALGTLIAGHTYTFGTSLLGRNPNQFTQLLNVQILNSSGVVVATLGSYATKATSGYTAFPDSVVTAAVLATFVPSATAVYSFRFAFSFVDNGTPWGSNGANKKGDDISVTAPTVACT